MDEFKAVFSSEQELVRRRRVPLGLASLPLALLGWDAQRGPVRQYIKEEEVVPACAASLTVCWHLLNGTDLALVEQTISGMCCCCDNGPLGRLSPLLLPEL